MSFTCVQPGPTTWVYTLTFAPEDNMNVTQSTTTITVNGLSGVTAASGPTSTDFPIAAFSVGSGSTAQIAPPAILNWTTQVKNNGTTVVWSITNVGTGNFSSVHSVFGFSITASASNGTAALVTSGFSRDTLNPLPGGGLGIDISGNVQGPAATSSVVLPQLVFGGSWYSAVYFTNTGATNASFNVKYTADNGAPMVIPATGTSSIPLPGLSAIVGQRGQVTFSVSNGNVAVLGLRFNG